MLLLLDLLSTFCFAGTAASIALRHKLNYPCVFLSALIASTGGGTSREFLLGTNELFWIETPVYLLVVLIAVQLSYFLKNSTRLPTTITIPADSFATAVFVVVGISSALGSNSSVLICLLMGVLTGIGGGIIRQIIFDRHSLRFNTLNILVTAYCALIGVFLITREINLPAIIALLGFVHLSLVSSRELQLLFKNRMLNTQQQ